MELSKASRMNTALQDIQHMNEYMTEIVAIDQQDSSKRYCWIVCFYTF